VSGSWIDDVHHLRILGSTDSLTITSAVVTTATRTSAFGELKNSSGDESKTRLSGSGILGCMEGRGIYPLSHGRTGLTTRAGALWTKVASPLGEGPAANDFEYASNDPLIKRIHRDCSADVTQSALDSGIICCCATRRPCDAITKAIRRRKLNVCGDNLTQCRCSRDLESTQTRSTLVHSA